MANYGDYYKPSDYYKSSQSSSTNFLDKFEERARRIIQRHKEYNPVIIAEDTRSICRSWWGKAWCKNLERYADWENRIERGKDYVKHNTVVDLQINGGKISADRKFTMSTINQNGKLYRLRSANIH